MPTVLFTKTCGRDLPLAKYQAGLIAKHWKNTPHHVWVVDSEAERRELIKALVSSYPSGYTSNEATYVLGESPPLDGAQHTVCLTSEVLPGEPHVLHGYLCQQVVKLLAGEYCKHLACDATFQIDADCMPSAPFDWDTFLPAWSVCDHVRWPIPRIAKEIPKWNALARELLDLEEVMQAIDASATHWTFMTGLGWWVPNEVGAYIVEQIVRKVLGLSFARAVTSAEIVRAFRQLQARSAAFSEYTLIGHTIVIVTALPNRKIFRDYEWQLWDDAGPPDPSFVPTFEHITMQPGGNGHHLPDATRAQLDAMLEAP